MKSTAARKFCWTSADSDPTKYDSCAFPQVAVTPIITSANSARVTISSARVTPRASPRPALTSRATSRLPQSARTVATVVRQAGLGADPLNSTAAVIVVVLLVGTPW